MKLRADGSDIEWSARFGGGGENARALTLDHQGNIYVAGDTSTDRLPVTPGAVDPDRSSGTYNLRKPHVWVYRTSCM